MPSRRRSIDQARPEPRRENNDQARPEPRRENNAVRLGAAALATALLCSCNAPSGRNHYVLAERLFSDRKYDAAVEQFKKSIESDPQGALAQQALFRIGVIQDLYLDHYPEAIKSFRQFSALSKNQDLVFQAEKTIGEIYFSKLEDYKLAAEQYRRLVERYPSSKEADYFLLRRGKAHYGALEFDRAVQDFRQVHVRFPKSPLAPEALYQSGNTFYTKGDTDAAIDAFEETVMLYPKSPQAVFAQFGIGNCYEEKDRFDEALQVFTAILEKHPARNVVEAKIKRLKERRSRAH